MGGAAKTCPACAPAISWVDAASLIPRTRAGHFRGDRHEKIAAGGVSELFSGGGIRSDDGRKRLCGAEKHLRFHASVAERQGRAAGRLQGQSGAGGQRREPLWLHSSILRAGI